jgi:hypothetical protein
MSMDARAIWLRFARKGAIMIMRRFALRLGIAALLASIPATGFAQTGRSGFSTSRAVGEREYWNALRWFGRCFARTAPQAAFDFLATEPGSAEENAIYTRLFASGDIECLGDMTQMSVVVRYVRGSIAEGLLLLNTRIPPRLTLYPPAPGAQITTLSEVSRCFAATHRAETRAMIADTRPGSAEEEAALGRMETELFRCVPPAASNIQLESTNLRYHLAEALLRLPPQPASTQR